MRIANTLKISAHSKTKQEQEALLEAFKTLTTVPCQLEELTHEEFSTMYITKLWLTRQQDIRSVLRFLARMPEKDKQQLKDQIIERLDERGNFYFRINKEEFMAGKAALKDKGDVLQLRINVSAHPKNTETLTQTVRDFLSTPDINL